MIEGHDILTLSWVLGGYYTPVPSYFLGRFDFNSILCVSTLLPVNEIFEIYF